MCKSRQTLSQNAFAVQIEYIHEHFPKKCERKKKKKFQRVNSVYEEIV